MSNYWQDRQKELYSALEKDENDLKIRLASVYEDEYSRLDKEIAAYYQKYGENNVIKYRNLMQTLPKEDVKLLIEQMDDFAAKYPQYAHLLPVRTSIYKLDRLEGLQYSVRMHQLNISAVNQQAISEHLNKQALRGANAAMETMGFGKNFYTVNSDIVKKFVDVPWCNGLSFSQRIWQDGDKLANYITTDIAQGFARGTSYQKLTKQLRTRFEGVAKKDAYRLIYTEGTYVMAESSIQPFTEDFDEYRISTAADGKVCDICASVARQTFKIKDRKPGINFPPFHPWCRCTFEIVEPADWDKWMDDYVKRHKSSGEKVLNNVYGNDIIMGGNARNYYEPVKYNSNASFKVSLNSYANEVNEGISRACYDVAKDGSKDGNEHLILVDLKNGKALYKETGVENAVGGSKFWEFLLKNPNGTYAFVHNHNTASKFSEADMRTLLGNNSIDMFVISRLDGKCYVVERNSKEPINSFFDKLYEEEMKELAAKVKSGEITSGERTYLRENILVNNLIRDFTKGLIKFE